MGSLAQRIADKAATAAKIAAPTPPAPAPAPVPGPTVDKVGADLTAAATDVAKTAADLASRNVPALVEDAATDYTVADSVISDLAALETALKPAGSSVGELLAHLAKDKLGLVI